MQVQNLLADRSIRRFRFVLILLLWLGFAVLAILAQGPDTLPGDVRILEWIQSIDGPGVNQLVRSTNWAMSGWPLTVLAILLSTIAFIRGRAIDSGVIVVVTLCRIVNPVLKNLVESPRPGSEFRQDNLMPNGLGFPSGHTSGAVLVVGAAVWVLSQRTSSPAKKLTMGVVTGFIILATGFGRIWVGAHWPSDVLGGLLWSIPVLLIVPPAMTWIGIRMGTDEISSTRDRFHGSTKV